ncbi:MAG: peptidase S14 [Sphingobium sp.]|nr:MAG: peptidase S14 [Sphingobium sp.]
MNPLLKLLALNKGKGQPIRAESGNDEDTIYIYDVITSDDFWGGVDGESFVRLLNSKTAPVIHLRINSPGGDVFAARSMVQAIREHKSKIIAHIDGMAASAATDIVMAADESYITDGGMFMIHNAWTIAVGNKDDFIKTADLLERVDQVIAQNYIDKSGQEPEQIKKWMDEETYFFGQEAVDAGFVNGIAAAKPKNQIKWDISAYKNAPPPKQENPEPDPEPKPDPAPEPDPTPKPEPQAPDLSAHYRQLEVVQLTA